MKRKCFNVFWSSLGAFWAVCWTSGIRNNEPAWAEAVLFFTITYLYLKKYDDRHMVIPVVLCMIAGREVLNVILNICTLLHLGSLQPVYSWFIDFISVLGIRRCAVLSLETVVCVDRCSIDSHSLDSVCATTVA